MWSADNGHTEIVKVLIQKGAALNTQDFDGWTALMKAVYGKHVEIVQTLIKNGADVNSKNVGGYTTLFVAEEIKAPPEIINMLKDAGAKM
jgi:ankyrin repeat protein